MISTPILLFICLLFIFLGQPTDASPTSNNSQQLEEDLYAAAGLNITRLDNHTRSIFDKITGMIYDDNVTLTKEQQKELWFQFFDVADQNKDDQLTSEEITETFMYLTVHFIKFQMNQQNMTEFERALILMLMKKELLIKLQNEIEQDVIRMIEKWDMDGDGKLSKKEAEESIKAELMMSNSFSTGKFKRAVDMKIAMENVKNVNERMRMIGNDAFEF